MPRLTISRCSRSRYVAPHSNKSKHHGPTHVRQIGRLGIIDHDVVEISNLQRQILHTDEKIGSPKAESAAQAIAALNSRVDVDVHPVALHSSNALSILAPYDVILDCTDNAPTRYLLSDTAVRLNKPLVSGAAQKFDGQLCVYNLGDDGPCYRCIFPKSPAPEMAGSCEETGILGAVTGIIGNLQALEAIKLITGLHGESDQSLQRLVVLKISKMVKLPCYFSAHFLSLRFVP